MLNYSSLYIIDFLKHICTCLYIFFQPVKPTKSTWRAQHEDFINTVRAARGVTKALERGEPLPPPPPPSLNPGKGCPQFD